MRSRAGSSQAGTGRGLVGAERSARHFGCTPRLSSSDSCREQDCDCSRCTPVARRSGYAYATHWHERSAYRHSVESTIYLRPDAVGQRIGTRLYETLISALRARRLHAVIAGIALPNPASSSRPMIPGARSWPADCAAGLDVPRAFVHGHGAVCDPPLGR
jgi:GNAT superfamily N-acetyltransferase